MDIDVLALSPSLLLVFDEARRKGLAPRWETSYGLFSITRGDKTIYVFPGKYPMNSHLHAHLATNKHITHIMLEKAGIAHVPYCFPQTRDELLAFFDEYHKIIAKPTMGRQSMGVRLLTPRSRVMNIDYTERIFERYLEGYEMRFLILDYEIIGVLEKHPHPLKGDRWHKWYKTVRPDEWRHDLGEIATKVAHIIQLGLCAVDIMITADAWYVLEVNSSPGFVKFHVPDEGPSINCARRIIEKIVG